MAGLSVKVLNTSATKPRTSKVRARRVGTSATPKPRFVPKSGFVVGEFSAGLGALARLFRNT